MCGRYAVHHIEQQIEADWKVNMPIPFDNNFNAAPSQQLPVVTNEAPNTLQYYRWGLVPFWAKDVKIGYKMINARSETLDQKPSFKKPLQQKRCLVPANGFYEWRKESPKVKTPFYIQALDQELMAFAGLWSQWHDPVSGANVPTFTIITCAPNPAMAQIHDRMPVILPKNLRAAWLDNQLSTKDHLSLLQPYDPAQMQAFPVHKAVGSPANNTETLIEAQGPRLF